MIFAEDKFFVMLINSCTILFLKVLVLLSVEVETKENVDIFRYFLMVYNIPRTFSSNTRSHTKRNGRILSVLNRLNPNSHAPVCSFLFLFSVRLLLLRASLFLVSKFHYSNASKARFFFFCLSSHLP